MEVAVSVVIDTEGLIFPVRFDIFGDGQVDVQRHISDPGNKEGCYVDVERVDLIPEGRRIERNCTPQFRHPGEVKRSPARQRQRVLQDSFMNELKNINKHLTWNAVYGWSSNWGNNQKMKFNLNS